MNKEEILQNRFELLQKLAIKYNASVNLPYLCGCDLAGGTWSIVEKIIIDELCSKDIDVVIYDINNRRKDNI